MKPLSRCVSAFIAVLALGTMPAYASEPAPYTLNVIAPTTGAGAFLGAAYVDSFRAIERVVNASGGIQGRALQIVPYDSQSNPQVGVQLLNGLIAKRVSVVIDGDLASICNAQAPLVTKDGPVLYCLSPLVYPPAGGFVFSSSISGFVLASVGVRYFRERGWTRIAVISSTDATGEDFDNQTTAALALPENRGVQLVARERFNPADLTVDAQIARIKSANPQAILVWSTGTAVATVFRGLQAGGLDLPVATSQANLIYRQMQAYATFLPKQLYFPTVRALTPDGTLRGPLRDAQAVYAKAFKAIGVKPDLANDLPWDPTMIVVDALRHLGPSATPIQIRDYILHLRGWVGVNGVYNFSGGDQRGIGVSAATVARWDHTRGSWVSAVRPPAAAVRVAR